MHIMYITTGKTYKKVRRRVSPNLKLHTELKVPPKFISRQAARRPPMRRPERTCTFACECNGNFVYQRNCKKISDFADLRFSGRAAWVTAARTPCRIYKPVVCAPCTTHGFTRYTLYAFQGHGRGTYIGQPRCKVTRITKKRSPVDLLTIRIYRSARSNNVNLSEKAGGNGARAVKSSLSTPPRAVSLFQRIGTPRSRQRGWRRIKSACSMWYVTQRNIFSLLSCRSMTTSSIGHDILSECFLSLALDWRST